MPANFLNRIPELDLVSFLFGLLLGGLLWAIILKVSKISSISKKFSFIGKEKTTRKSSAHLIEIINMNTLRVCQSSHLAGFFIPLAKVYVPLELIYPYPYLNPSLDLPDAYESSQALPYIPELPEYYENIPLPSISLLSALSKHNLISIQGEIGSGKTTIINAAMSDIIEKIGDGQLFTECFPIYLHYSGIDFQKSETIDPFVLISQSSQFSVLHLPETAVKKIITTYADANKLLLFIDGLDELDSQSINRYINWIQNLLANHPQLRIVVANNLSYSDDLEKIGFTTFFLSPLTATKHQSLKAHWSDVVFNSSIRDNLLSGSLIPEIDSIWSNQINQHTNFFFTTLSFINDFSLSGNSGTQKSLLHSFIIRLCNDIDDYECLKKLAEEIYIRSDHLIECDVLNNLLKRSSIPESQSSLTISATEKTQPEETLLQKLLRTRIIVERKPDYFGFHSLLIFGFLLGDSYTRKTDSNWIHYYSNPLEETALRFNQQSDYLFQWIQQPDSQLHRNVPMLLNHIYKCENNRNELNQIAPVLLSSLENNSIPFSSRLKYLSLLHHIDAQYAMKIIEYLLSNKSNSNKQMAIIGLGFQKSAESISLLRSMLSGLPVLEKTFAVLSLFRLWDSVSRKAIMESLTNGDDFFRRMVCEMFATRLPDGKDLLLDLSTNGSIAMRKASIFGLKLIKDTEIGEHITKVIAVEKEWIVRDTAVRALDEINTNKLNLNQSTPPQPDGIDWLVAFASKHGTGIAANTIPYELLFDVVKSGNDPEKFAALNILKNNPSTKVMEYLTSLSETQDYIGDRAYFYLSELLRREILY